MKGGVFMYQITEFVIGYDEAVYGKNDSLEEVLSFIRNAAIGKTMRVTVTTNDKDETN